nr:anchored repeat-type ABC transporter ATP-binding subunit [Corynebacterium lactis]
MKAAAAVTGRPLALDVDSVAVSLAGRAVLRETSLKVSPGEFVGLIGPNGAGKTTLLRSILGIVPTRTGTIAVAGRSGKKAIDHVGYVPQRHEFAWDYPINIHDTVLGGRTRHIGLFRSAKEDDYAAVARALEQVKLSDLAERPIGELSGGQRQRVLVARALATAPDLLLLDEPFTGLDMPSWELLLGLFEELAAGGVAIVMSTHNLPEAMDICHRVALLRGTVRAVGTPKELLAPELVPTWMDTFQVHRGSPLLKSVGIGPETVPAPEGEPAQ